MAQDSFSDQYWQQFNPGAAARSSLAHEHYTEYSAFAGADIKAFIIPQGDEVALKELRKRLQSWDDSLRNNVAINSTNVGLQMGMDIVEGTDRFAEHVASHTDAPLAKDILPLVNLQSITISTFRAKSQVRALGHVNALGLARGSRTVAGTFILTEFNRDTFWDILVPTNKDVSVGDTGMILPDQMRPFDVLLMFTHEMGNIAIRHIYGLEIVTNGSVYSIQDYYSENTLSYMAHDISPLIPLNSYDTGGDFYGLADASKKLSNLISTVRSATASAEYEYLRRARNPFI